MTKDNNQRLKQLLASYGADPARWPEEDRHLSPLSQDLAHEARSLDRRLDEASAPRMPEGLTAKIIAAAGAQEGEDNVVPFRAPVTRRRYWPAAAAMAASLALGIFLGGTSGGDFFLPQTDEAALDDPLDLIGLGQTDDDAGDPA